MLSLGQEKCLNEASYFCVSPRLSFSLCSCARSLRAARVHTLVQCTLSSQSSDSTKTGVEVLHIYKYEWSVNANREWLCVDVMSQVLEIENSHFNSLTQIGINSHPNNGDQTVKVQTWLQKRVTGHRPPRKQHRFGRFVLTKGIFSISSLCYEPFAELEQLDKRNESRIGDVGLHSKETGEHLEGWGNDQQVA